METSKKDLRKQANNIYNQLPSEYKINASDIISKLLFNEKIFIEAETILIYLSTDYEPSTRYLINEILKHNRKLYVPVCVDDHKMKICRITKDTVFSENIYGIKEPENPVFDEITPDLVIMPCVAISKEKTRLGHGKGYYDRYLSERKTNTVCLCFSKLIFDKIPQDEYDIIPDIVITENGIIN